MSSLRYYVLKKSKESKESNERREMTPREYIKNPSNIEKIKNPIKFLSKLYSVEDLKNDGFSLQEIIDAGFKFQEIVDAGYKIEEILETDMTEKKFVSFINFLKYYLREHKEIKFYNLLDKHIRKNNPENNLNMRDYRALFDYTCEELKEMGFSYTDIINAGCTKTELFNIGFQSLTNKIRGLTRKSTAGGKNRQTRKKKQRSSIL